MFRGLAAGLVLAALAGTALAGVNVSSVTQKHWRSVTSIAVQATVLGDDDTNAVAQIFQRRRASASFDSGMVMSRRPGTHLYGGRILWLPAGDTCDFYIEARDGATVRSVVDTATCARIPYFTPDINLFIDTYANAATGQDFWDGTSPTFLNGTVGPKKTIQAAVNAMSGFGADDGSTVHVANGEYHEAVTLSGATNGFHYRLL